VAEFALRHRRRNSQSNEQSAQAPTPPNNQSAAEKPDTAQGHWGELPAQAVTTGQRREVPSWPKKP
jgi:magnesium chelatase subunit I